MDKQSIYDVASAEDMSLTDALKIAGISHRRFDGLARELFRTETGELVGRFNATSAWNLLKEIPA